MPGKPYPSDVLEQAQSVFDAMNQIDASMSVGTINSAKLSIDIATATQLVSQMNSLEAQLTNLRNERDTLYTPSYGIRSSACVTGSKPITAMILQSLK